MVFDQWEGRNLGDILKVADTVTLEASDQANTPTDPDAIRALLYIANMMSFNLLPLWTEWEHMLLHVHDMSTRNSVIYCSGINDLARKRGIILATDVEAMEVSRRLLPYPGIFGGQAVVFIGLGK